MAVEIVTEGYIVVWRDGVQISRHSVETKAIEAAIAHSAANGDGDYELRFPRKVLMSRLGKKVIPFRVTCGSWGGAVHEPGPWVGGRADSARSGTRSAWTSRYTPMERRCCAQG